MMMRREPRGPHHVRRGASYARLSASRSGRARTSSSPAPGEPPHGERQPPAAPAAARNAATAVRRGRPGLAGVAVLCLALLGFAVPAKAQTEVPADWTLIPSELGPGDSFRLIFISSTKRNGNPTTIATYNTFVQNRAAAGHADIQDYSSDFRVVGSTADDDARDNTGTTFTNSDTGVPIYWLGGTKVADNYADFYDRSWDDEANPRDESGNAAGFDFSDTNDRPFTGSNHDGTVATSPRHLGGTIPRVGRPNDSGTGQGPIQSTSAYTKTTPRRFYGLSPVFRVAIPPTLSTATVDGTALVLTYDEALDGSSTPAASAYSVSVAGGTGTAPSTVAVSGMTVTLTLATAVTAGQDVTVSYTVPGSNPVQDQIGLPAAAFTNERVINNTGVVAPTITALAMASTPADGTAYDTGETIEIELTFSAAVNVTGTGTPFLTFVVGDSGVTSRATADYDSGSGTTKLVFAYTVQSGDMDPTGVFILKDENCITNPCAGGNTAITLGADSAIVAKDSTIAANIALTVGGGVKVNHKVDATMDATGVPEIYGDPRVGQTLTVQTTKIMDPDGLPDTFTYQWLRVDGGTETSISNTAATYTVTSADEGKQVKVRVTFTDDEGNAEGPLTSIAFPRQGFVILPATLPDTTCDAPTLPGRTEIWRTELDVGSFAIGSSMHFGWFQFHHSLPVSGSIPSGEETFSINDIDYNVTAVRLSTVPITQIQGVVALPPGIGIVGEPTLDIEVAHGRFEFYTDADKYDWSLTNETTQLQVHVCDETLNFTDSQYAFGHTHFWLDSGLDWSTHGTRILRISINNPPLLEDAIVDGSTLTLTYSEDLNTTAPAPAAFTVKVDDQAGVNPTDVTIDGRTVILTLGTEVASGRMVTVSYTKPSSNPIQDTEGLEASAFTDKSIRNVFAARAPDAPVLTATGVNTGASLVWTAPRDNGAAIEKYQYRQRPDGGTSWDPDWTDIPDGSDAGDSAADETAFSVSGLTNDTTYRYEVRAVNTVGDGLAAEDLAAPMRYPVCERTEQVKGVTNEMMETTGIVAAVSGVDACDDVTVAHLGAIASLNLSGDGIAALKSGDFAGLTALETLGLGDNDLTGLPADIFAGLTALTDLTLGENNLGSLPAGLFDGLVSLEAFGASSAGITALPEGLFDDAPGFEWLVLDSNELVSLPESIFDNLTALGLISLLNNNLAALPDGVFEDQPAKDVDSLELAGNPGSATFIPTANAGHDRNVQFGTQVQLDGTGSDGGPWGTNVTYEWTKTSGPDVTLTDADTLTPSFTAPTSPGVLVFELQVTGKFGERSDTDTVTLRADAAPVVSSATVDGTSLVITFNADLAPAASLVNTPFTVKKTTSGTESEVDLTGSPDISGPTVTLTLDTAVAGTDTDIKVSYAKPDSGANNKLVDGNGNEVVDFTDQPVDNNTIVVVAIEFAETTQSVGEGDVAVRITLTASHPPSSRITVNLSYAAPDSGAAADADDYRRGPTSVVFPINSTEQGITAIITEDEKVEGTESFLIHIDSVQGGTVGPQSSIKVDILDNDVASVNFTERQTTTTEGEPIQLTVLLTCPDPVSGSCAGHPDLTVTYTIAAGTAEQGDDYTPPDPLEVLLPIGSTTATIEIPTVGDDVDEYDETFTVTLVRTSIPDLYMIIPGGVKTSTATIEDDDPAGGPGGAGCAERLDHEPGGGLVGRGGWGRAVHRLRGAVPAKRGRAALAQLAAHGHGDASDHRRAYGGHGIRGAGAGEERTRRLQPMVGAGPWHAVGDRHGAADGEERQGDLEASHGGHLRHGRGDPDHRNLQRAGEGDGHPDSEVLDGESRSFRADLRGLRLRLGHDPSGVRLHGADGRQGQ